MLRNSSLILLPEFKNLSRRPSRLSSGTATDTAIWSKMPVTKFLRRVSLSFTRSTVGSLSSRSAPPRPVRVAASMNGSSPFSLTSRSVLMSATPSESNSFIARARSCPSPFMRCIAFATAMNCCSGFMRARRVASSPSSLRVGSASPFPFAASWIRRNMRCNPMSSVLTSTPDSFAASRSATNAVAPIPSLPAVLASLSKLLIETPVPISAKLPAAAASAAASFTAPVIAPVIAPVMDDAKPATMLRAFFRPRIRPLVFALMLTASDATVLAIAESLAKHFQRRLRTQPLRLVARLHLHVLSPPEQHRQRQSVQDVRIRLAHERAQVVQEQSPRIVL